MKLFNTFMTRKYNSMLISSLLALVVSVGMASMDYLLAGILLGADGASIVNMVAPVTQVGLFIASMIGIGAPIIYNDKVGKFDKEGANSIFTVGIIMAVAMGVVFAGLVLLLGETYLGMYSISPEVYGETLAYYRVMAISVLIKPINVVTYNMVFMDGDSAIANLSICTALVSKIVLSVILTKNYGVVGLGIAGVLSYGIYLAIGCIHFFKKNNSLKLSRKPAFKSLGHIFSFSLIDASVYLYSAVLSFVLNTITQNRFGASAILLATIINFVKELYRLTDSIGATMEPFVNIYHGQESHDGTRKTLANSMVWALIIGIAGCIILMFVARPLAGYMGVTDPEMLSVSVTGIRILSIGFIFNSITFCLTSYYLYIEEIKTGFLITFVNDFLMVLIGILVCTKLFGTIGAFIGPPVGAAIALVLALLLVRIIHGKENYPTLLSHNDDIKDDRVLQYEIEESSIQNLKDEVERFLANLGYDQKNIMESLLVIEDMSLYIKEVNAITDKKKESQRVYAECSIIAGKDITIVICDDGKLMDMSDVERDITSLRSYIITLFVSKKAKRVRNLMTMGNNRCAFEIPCE